MNFGKKAVPFKPYHDIPSLDGKVIIVTGGNIGLGRQCVLEYARHKPATIFLAARNQEKAKAALVDIEKQLSGLKPVIKILELDLASIDSVKRAAARVTAESDRLDILMLNAGIMATPPGLTKDGYELQFGTNYVGHALFAKLLLPLLNKTASAPGSDVRIIMLSSHGHMYAPKPDGILFSKLNTECEDLGAYNRYGQSKLAMILWTRKMAKLYPQFTLASIHPGIVDTNLMNNATGSPLPIRILAKVLQGLHLAPSVEQGVKNQLWASAAEGVESGEYYEPVGIGGTATELGKDMHLAEKLWDWTSKELEPYYL